MLFILISGCTFVIPDHTNYTVSYIRVSPSFATMKVNTTKVFKVYAYDSEDNVIPVEASKVTWEWAFECPLCGVVAEVKPESGSITTSFLPNRAGLYHIYAYYKGKKDNSPIEVLQ
jgi:hypothetical protein